MATTTADEIEKQLEYHKNAITRIEHELPLCVTVDYREMREHQLRNHKAQVAQLEQRLAMLKGES
jgi:hypothetical protein